VRNVKGVTFSGGTSTGKVENDWCDIRNAVPENGTFATNPYCNVQSPFQTSFNGQARTSSRRRTCWSAPCIVNETILNGTPNNSSTDQLAGSLPATFTYTATDATGQAIAAQIGRPLTGGPFSVNVVHAGHVSIRGRNRQLD
jgi:hypothetical protein